MEGWYINGKPNYKGMYNEKGKNKAFGNTGTNRGNIVKRVLM
jgi:hypothetical protein